jgi:ferredoxin
MADRTDKNPLNAPGKYYNDHTCIDCGLCPDLAPGVFRRDDAEGYSYVWQQPVTAADIAAAAEALSSCPTESIGQDG